MSKNRNSKLKNTLFSIISVFLGLIIGFVGELYFSLPDSYIIPQTVQGTVINSSSHATEGLITEETVEVVKSKDISFHFIELGNKYTGDCIYIKCGDTDILVDGGSRASSVPFIYNYIDSYMTDDCLDYIIVTHAHQDHYAAFAATDSLFDHYSTDGKSIGLIIDFDKTNQLEKGLYASYLREKAEAVRVGATNFTAMQCYSNNNDSEEKEINEKEANRFYKIGEDSTGSDIILQILYTKYYEEKDSHGENNHSVCFQIIQGQNKYLFTGDLEKEGEEDLVSHTDNNLSKVQLYKAGHHGSKSSSTSALLSVIQPEYVVVCCCAGSSEYTSTLKNQFPTQQFIDRVSVHTDRIYVTSLCIDYKSAQFTSMNGNIIFFAEGTLTYLRCSNNLTKLRETDWFKQYRIWPENGKIN